MRRFPSPPIMAASLSGFVIGVILTLLSTGIMSSGAHTNPVATLPPATPVADPQIYAAVTKVVRRQLGASYPDQKKGRLLHLDILPAGPTLEGRPMPATLLKKRSINIVFRLNDHPLGKPWRLKAAKADVFGIMEALYTSQLPIYNVELEGLFPLPTQRGVKDRVVMIAYMDHLTASTIPWKRWGRESEGKLWNVLPYHHVDPRFA